MDSPEHPDGASVPKSTTPTWEMELLVSGGTVFGLMQLSGVVDDTFVTLYNRAGDDISYALMPLWVYVKFVLVTLIGTFLVHLCLRGYWVALVGMDSVFPGGVDWSKLRMGPLSRRYAESNTQPMPVEIENADNRATRVFGIGFGFAMMMLVPIGLALFSILASMAVRALFGLDDTKWVFAALFIVVFVPWGVAVMVDQRWGSRIREGSVSFRILQVSFAFYDRLGIGRNTNLLMSTLMSRIGVQRWGWMSAAVMGVVFTVVVFQLVFARIGMDFGEFPGLPDRVPYAANSTPSMYYGSQGRDAADLAPMPYIPDRVARGPYVELFVPYLPRRHAPALRRACPDALASAEKGDARASLDCLARLLDVRVDDQSLALSFDASNDPKTGLPGVLAMVPVRDLAPGRHELSLVAVNTRREVAGEPARRYRIPFWK